MTVKLQSWSVPQKISETWSMLRFIAISENTVVVYHRQVILAALLPVFYAISLFVSLQCGIFNSTFFYRAVQFVGLLSACYSACLVRSKVLPRNQTYQKWQDYMESVKLNRHVRSVLDAYYLQMQRGNAPASGSPEAAAIPPETLNIWKTKNTGLTPPEVEVKFVNFCWRYAYRLWCNKMNFTTKNSNTNAPSSAEEDIPELDDAGAPALAVPHGDAPATPLASQKILDRLLPSSEQVKLKVLEKLADRVSKYADALQGGEHDDYDTLTDCAEGDDTVLAKLEKLSKLKTA